MSQPVLHYQRVDFGLLYKLPSYQQMPSYHVISSLQWSIQMTLCDHILYAERMANFQPARPFSISPSLKSASGPPLSDQSIESSILVYEKHFNIPSGKQR